MVTSHENPWEGDRPPPGLPPSVCTYNVRSLLSRATGWKRRLRQHCTISSIRSVLNHGDILGLQETNLAKNDHVYLQGRFPAYEIFCSNETTRKGGVALLVSRRAASGFQNLIHEELIPGHAQALSCWPGGGHQLPMLIINLRLDASTIAAKVRQLELLTTALKPLKAEMQAAGAHLVTLMGDFNFTEHAADGLGSESYYTPAPSLAAAFQELTMLLEVHEIMQDGFSFWRRRAEGLDAARLDRIYLHQPEAAWDLVEPEAFIPPVAHLPHTKVGQLVSDHAPVLLRWQPVMRPSNLFRCKRHILRDPLFFSIFAAEWEDMNPGPDDPEGAMANFLRCIKKAYREAKPLIEDNLTNPLRRIARLRELLRALTSRSPDHDLIGQLLEPFPELRQRTCFSLADGYDVTGVMEEMTSLYEEHATPFLNTSDADAISKWGSVPGIGVTFGDESAIGPAHIPRPLRGHSKLLQSLAVALPSSRQSVTSLLADDQDPASRTSNPAAMGDIIADFWDAKWGKRDPRSRESAIRRFLCTYDAEVDRTPLMVITQEHVREVIAASKSSSAGVDGIPFLAFRILREFATPVIARYAHGLAEGSFIASADFNECILYSLVKKPTGKVKDTRPISVPNCINRIISQILCRMLTASLKETLHPAQRAGVPGRNIADNIFELNTWISQRVQARHQGYVLLVDFTKAFDSVSHKYLHEILKAAGVPEYHRRLFAALLHDVTARPFVGGKLSDRVIKVCCGIKQGDPCSPILFCLTLDPLLRQLADLGVERIGGFMDDLAATFNSLQCVDEIAFLLLQLGKATGLFVNLDKTLALYAMPPSEEELGYLANSAWPNLRLERKARYLGVMIGTEVTTADVFENAVAKFTKRIQNYSAMRYRFRLAKRVLITNVFLLPIFLYLIQFYFMPAHMVAAVSDLLRKWLIPLGHTAFPLRALARPWRLMGMQEGLHWLYTEKNIPVFSLTMKSKSWVRVQGTGLHGSSRSSWALRHIRHALKLLHTYQVPADTLVENIPRNSEEAALTRRAFWESPKVLAMVHKEINRILHKAGTFRRADRVLASIKALPAKPKAHIQACFFLFMHNAWPVRARTAKCRPRTLRSDVDQPQCQFCNTGPESKAHLFRECPAVLNAAARLSRIHQVPWLNQDDFWQEIHLLLPEDNLKRNSVIAIAFVSAVWFALKGQWTLDYYNAAASTGRIINLFHDTVTEQGTSWRRLLDNPPAGHLQGYDAGLPDPPEREPNPGTAHCSDSDFSDDSEPLGHSATLWPYQRLLGTRVRPSCQALTERDPSGRRPRRHFDIKVLWEDGSSTFEPYSLFAISDELNALFS